jgi:hypothetical protein
MTRRRLLLLALSVAVVLLGVGAWALWPQWPCTAITRDNAERIQVGMTLAEVEAILGGPPRGEMTGTVEMASDEQSDFGLHHLQFKANLAMKTWPPEWQSDEVVVAVRFDDAGRVSARHYLFLRRAEAGPLSALRRWLRL